VCAIDVKEYMERTSDDHGPITIVDRDALDAWPIPARQRRRKSKEDIVTTVQKNASMKASAISDDSDGADDDEDEGIEADDDEDDAPKAKKSKKEKPAKKKGFGKKAKADDEDEALKAKPKKAAKEAKPAKRTGKIADTAMVTKVKPRTKGGAKTKLMDLIAKKGMSVASLTVGAKEAGLSPSKVKGWLTQLEKFGYVAIK
jgi:hypothetical protein